MAFDVAGEAYDRFMGRYSGPLGTELLRLVDPQPGDRALDVGCGPGILTRHLVDRLGTDAVVAVDPSPPFVQAVRSRLPGVEIHQTGAEQLPFDDDAFDLALAQLVVPFMSDPGAGLREMRRVTRPGGVVAATSWNHADEGSSPLSPFWRAVQALDPDSYDESSLVGVRDGDLAARLDAAGLHDVRQHTLTVRVVHASFAEWWEPYTLGVGPAGDHVAHLDEPGRRRLQDQARSQLGDGPIEVTGTAWCAVGRA